MTIAEEAQQIVQGDRREDYGPARESFARIAAAWSPIVGKTLTPADVALMMIVFKVHREHNKHKRDNLVDIIGYAILCQGLSEPPEITPSV